MRLNIIKKDPSVDVSSLKIREKTEIVNALKDLFVLDLMLDKKRLSHSVYYHEIPETLDEVFQKSDKVY